MSDLKAMIVQGAISALNDKIKKKAPGWPKYTADAGGVEVFLTQHPDKIIGYVKYANEGEYTDDGQAFVDAGGLWADAGAFVIDLPDGATLKGTPEDFAVLSAMVPLLRKDPKLFKGLDKVVREIPRRDKRRVVAPKKGFRELDLDLEWTQNHPRTLRLRRVFEALTR